MLYLLLATVSAAVAYLGYRRGPVPTFVASVLGMAASLGLTDLLLVGMLRLYLFRPYLAPTASQDNPLGFFLADFFSVPLLYTGIAQLFPSRRVQISFVLTGALAGVEYGFLRAGIYFHQGWSIWYSVPLFVLRFLVAAWWLPKFQQIGYTPAFRAFLTALSVHSVWMTWMIWISSIGRVWIIRPLLLAGGDPDRVLGAALYHGLPFGVIAYLAVMMGWGRSARGLAVTALPLAGYLLWLDSSGMWRRGNWGPWLETAALLILVLAVAAVDHWFATHLPARARIPT